MSDVGLSSAHSALRGHTQFGAAVRFASDYLEVISSTILTKP